jgi:hypothetical protein
LRELKFLEIICKTDIKRLKCGGKKMDHLENLRYEDKVYGFFFFLYIPDLELKIWESINVSSTFKTR